MRNLLGNFGTESKRGLPSSPFLTFDQSRNREFGPPLGLSSEAQNAAGDWTEGPIFPGLCFLELWGAHETSDGGPHPAQ